MPDTIDHVHLAVTGYEDIYALSGIAIGTPLVIQNQTPNKLKIHIGSTKPDENPIPDPEDGSPYDPVIPVEAYVLVPPQLESFVYVENGASGCWIDGNGPISVQEDL